MGVESVEGGRGRLFKRMHRLHVIKHRDDAYLNLRWILVLAVVIVKIVGIPLRMLGSCHQSK